MRTLLFFTFTFCFFFTNAQTTISLGLAPMTDFKIVTPDNEPQQGEFIYKVAPAFYMNHNNHTVKLAYMHSNGVSNFRQMVPRKWVMIAYRYNLNQLTKWDKIPDNMLFFLEYEFVFQNHISTIDKITKYQAFSVASMYPKFGLDYRIYKNLAIEAAMGPQFGFNFEGESYEGWLALKYTFEEPSKSKL